MLPPRVLVVLAAGLMFSVVAVAQPAPPDWSLRQSYPDPFCNAGGGGTAIEFFVAAQAHIVMEVWHPDTSFVEKTLIDGMLSPGFHTVVWDGSDAQGAKVPDGSYPYRLTATNESGTELLFQDTKVAQVFCATPAELSTWGKIKALYR